MRSYFFYHVHDQNAQPCRPGHTSSNPSKYPPVPDHKHEGKYHHTSTCKLIQTCPTNHNNDFVIHVSHARLLLSVLYHILWKKQGVRLPLLFTCNTPSNLSTYCYINMSDCIYLWIQNHSTNNCKARSTNCCNYYMDSMKNNTVYRRNNPVRNNTAHCNCRNKRTS